MSRDDKKNPTVWIDVTIKATTDEAVLVYNGKKEAWIPRSQIVDSVDDIERGAETKIEVREWIAEDKGLV